ncbi:MAG TPA: serine hydrolase [Gemmatimonadales bacterium]|nr:serine hydrolase [Gemmatimonadales bacterium]
MRILSTLILVAGLASHLHAQDGRSAKVDSIFAAMDRTTTPGCAVGAVQNGRFVHRRGYGMADLERGVPINTETVFYSGSVSKQFTAMSIALLARDGKISLDDPARKYVPEIPESGAGITIRQMVHHMSGLREKWDLFLLRGLPEGYLVTQNDVLEVLKKQRDLSFEPGTDQLYNNTAYDMLATIVQRASGKSIRDFAAERIFGPLGMQRSQYVDDWTLLVPGRAAGHSVQNGKVSLAAAHVETVGSGSVYTTVEDLARWDESFYTGQLGGDELLRLVQTPGKFNNGTVGPMNYAFGLMVDTWRGLRRVHHGGALAGFRSEIMRFPDQHFSALVMCNLAQVNPQALAERIAEVYLADKLGPAAVAASSPQAETKPSEPALTGAALAAYAGKYASPELDLTWTVAQKGDGLVATVVKGREVPMKAAGKDSYTVDNMKVKFARDAKGRVNGLLLTPGRSRNIRFDRH